MIKIKSNSSETIYLKTIGIELKSGSEFNCNPSVYAQNAEIKNLIALGVLRVVHTNQSSLAVRNTNKRVIPKQTIKKEVQIVKQEVDLDAIAEKVISAIGNNFSAELIAQAIASKIPTQIQTVQTVKNEYNTQSDELTFIPSSIIDNNIKSSSDSLANTTNSEDDISDTLKALKALRKAKKQ